MGIVRRACARLAARLAGILLFAGAIGLPALALECPVAQTSGRAGVIAEPDAVIAAMAPLLGGPDAAARAGEIVARVRARYPGAPSDEIVNFLVTAYCPIVNGENLAEPEKVARVNAFAAAVTQQLY
ncbi:MAG: hypothetical protein K2Y29_03980 [Beijerinckiaceae bacterium]|nr:hypothetical protein [Beijerinckiaceae bacterium]